MCVLAQANPDGGGDTLYRNRKASLSLSTLEVLASKLSSSSYL